MTTGVGFPEIELMSRTLLALKRPALKMSILMEITILLDYWKYRLAWWMQIHGT